MATLADLEAVEVTRPSDFILGGNAEFSIQNMSSGIKYSYKVVKAPDSENLYFVRVAVGNSYEYAGTLRVYSGGISYSKGAKGRYSNDDPPIKGLLFALTFERYGLRRPMIMYHHGRCAKCGRKLKDAESVSRGFGPECYKRIK